MNLKTFSLLILAMALTPAAFSADKPAQAGDRPLCGGYSQVEIDPEVKAAASFAVKAEVKTTGKPIRLVEVVKAEKQVVAGLNYRIDLKVQDGEKILRAQAVVWRKLDGSHSLTSWDWIVK